MTTRRAFLKNMLPLGSLMLFGASFSRSSHAQQNGKDLYASACRKPDGTFAFIVFDATGKVVRGIALQGRGHDCAFHVSTGRVTGFARRPGNFALAFNIRNSSPPKLFTTPQDRHFYGHGVYSNDGRLLYSTENDFANNRGIIGIYDATNNYQRIGEFASHGIGPHDVTLLHDGQILAVANGGIETHPDMGRTKLNLESMQANLSFLDTQTGDLLSQHQLAKDIHKLSIRHLAPDASGNIWFGCQWEGDLRDTPALIGKAGLDQDIAMLDATAPLAPALRGYIGSICANGDGRWLAASAPRANQVIFVDTKLLRLAGTAQIADGCGVAASVSTNSFKATNGFGELHDTQLSSSPATPVNNISKVGDFAFDNHLAKLASTF